MSFVFKPNSFPEDNINSFDKEYLVYEKLRELPPEADGLTVIYHPDFNYGHAEADFLLLHPNFGCLILEVKNWNLNKLDKREGKITTNGSNVNPKNQLRNYQFRLKEYLQKKLPSIEMGIKIPIDYKLLLINPSCNALQNPDDFFEVPTIKEEMVHYNGDFWKALQPKNAHPFRRDNDKKILKAIADLFYRTEKPEIVEAKRCVEYKPTDDILDATTFAKLTPVEQYQKTKELLLDSLKELGEMLPKDNTFEKDCTTLASNVKNDELRVGLFGLTGAGKSTFINALLGFECMRMGLGETTRVVTELRRSDESHPSGSVELEYKTLSELNDEVKKDVANEWKIDKAFTIENASTRDKLRKWAEETEDPDDSAFVEAVIKGWDTYHDRLGTTNSDFIGSDVDTTLHTSKGERLAVFIKKRKLYFDAPFLMKDMVLLDTPGFGSGVRRHTDLAMELAKKLDVILLLDKVKAPVMKEEKECIHRLFENNKTQQMNAGGAQFICILNQLTEIPPGESIEEQITRFLKRLEESGIRNVPVYGIDAAQAFWAKRKKIAEKLPPNEEAKYKKYCKCHSYEEDYNQSRFEDIEGKLSQYLIDNKYKVGIRRKIEEFNLLTTKIQDHFALKLSLISVKDSKIAERLSLLEHQKESCKNEIVIFKEENLTEILEITESNFMKQHNISNELLNLYKTNLAKIGRIPLGSKRRKKLATLICKGLMNKLQILQEELKRTYITMRDKHLKKRIEEIICREWPDFKVGSMNFELKTHSIENDELCCFILPGFWNMLVNYFNATDNFKSHFKEIIEPLLEQNIHRNIGSWTADFIEGVEKDLHDLIQPQEEALTQAINDKKSTENEIKYAQIELQNCQAKLTELKLKIKPIVDYLQHITNQSCITATLDLNFDNGNLMRRLTIDNRTINLPVLENLQNKLACYEEQWRLIFCNAEDSSLENYAKDLEKLIAWKDIDSELNKVQHTTNILQMNLSSELAGLPYELITKSSSRKYSILRKISVDETIHTSQTDNRTFLLVSSDDDVNPPVLLNYEIDSLQTLCQQHGWTFRKFKCLGDNWMNNLAKEISKASIVHFAGHGCQKDSPVFILNQKCFVGPEIFEGLDSCPKMLWMNNCYGGNATSNGFVKTAASVGIPIVIGSSVTIKDIDAWTLPAKTYEPLFEGKTIGQVVMSLSAVSKLKGEISIYADASATVCCKT